MIMFARTKLILTIAGGLLVASPFLIGAVAASDGAEDPSVLENDAGFVAPQDVQAYWTAQRMENAIPMPFPEFVQPEGASDPSRIQMELDEAVGEPLIPHVTKGWRPGSGPQPDPLQSEALLEFDDAIDSDLSDAQPQIYGTAPTDPLNGPYAPFQRWTWYGNYAAQDTQTIGKLFFTDGTYDYSCSATVIGHRTIATASHCVHKGGSNGFYTGWMFCPSWYRAGGSGGPYPSRGCWGWSLAKVSTAWVTTTGGAADRDYACIVTSPTGDTVADEVGNVTGWVGRGWNFSSTLPVFSFGYAAETPFPGYHIIAASSPEWYEVDMTIGDGQVSKYMGNDMTGGSSGGPWWMGVAHKVYEYPDTDGSNATDPYTQYGPYLVGLNSHKRCKSFCYEPPTSSYGTFWQEMGSPQFRGTTTDTDESEDVFQYCLNYE